MLQVLEAVPWIRNTGAQWHMLPPCHHNYKMEHRCFEQWCEPEILRAVLVDLANELPDRGEIDETKCFIDAMSADAKDSGARIASMQYGKGVKIMAIGDRHGLPFPISTHAANRHDVTLVQLSSDFYMIEAVRAYPIADNAYDSDALDKSPKKRDTATIAPHRSNRTLTIQGIRQLRRYARRWLAERYFAWSQWKRNLVVRWEYYASNFLGFVELVNITMLPKRIRDRF